MNWYEKVTPGDKLSLINDFYYAAINFYKINNPVEILAVRKDNVCKSGLLFKVKTDNLGTIELDASWFINPE